MPAEGQREPFEARREVPPTSGSEPEAVFRRWLLLTQYYHPEVGAPQIRLRAFARELNRRGCEVRILTALPNYPLGRIFPEYRRGGAAADAVDGNPVDRLWLYPAAGRKPVRRILCYLSFTANAIWRSLVAPKPDVVFIEAQPLTLALAGLIWKLRGVPYIYNTPDLQVEVAGDASWMPAALLLRAAGALEAFLIRQALCLSTVTRAFIEHFEQERGIARSRITFLPNGADLDRLRPLPPDREYARELGVEGKVVFTYAGTHANYHGLELILDAAGKLLDRDDIRILMVGQGPIREQLRRQAGSQGLTNVLFRDSDFEERARLMSITRAALATVAPIAAAKKMRLAKAVPPLACGVPVIYAGDGETVGMLREADCGVATAPGSAEELAAAMRALAGDEAGCRRMGRNGRALAEREFSWSFIVSGWLAEVERIVRADGKAAV